MVARTAFTTVLVGLLVAALLFAWTEIQTGRASGVNPFLPGFATPTSLAFRPTAASRATIAPTPVAPTSASIPRSATSTVAIARKEPLVSIPTVTAVPRDIPATPRPIAASPALLSPTRQVDDRFRAYLVILRDELESEIKTAVAGSGFALRNPGVRFQTPDRIVLTAGLPLAIFVVPIELEARVFVDDTGAVRVQTTRVDAINASLPSGIAATLSQQVDEQGGRVISAALPPGAKARRVAVLEDRVQVELIAR